MWLPYLGATCFGDATKLWWGLKWQTPGRGLLPVWASRLLPVWDSRLLPVLISRLLPVCDSMLKTVWATRKGTAASLSQLAAAILWTAGCCQFEPAGWCQFEPAGWCQFEPAGCCQFELAVWCQFEPEERGLLPVWATRDQTDGSLIHQECCQFKPTCKLRLILFSPLKRMITWWTLQKSALFWKSTLFTVFQELSVPWMSGLTARTVIVNTSLSTLHSQNCSL